MRSVPKDRMIVTESGILNPSDVMLMQANGINAFLVGVYARSRTWRCLKRVVFPPTCVRVPKKQRPLIIAALAGFI